MAKGDQLSVPGNESVGAVSAPPTPEAVRLLTANARLNDAVSEVMRLEVELRQARADERRARSEVAAATRVLGGFSSK